MKELRIAPAQGLNSARLSEPEAVAMIERLHQDGGFRVLRKIDIREGRTAVDSDLSRAKAGVVVDIDASGATPGVDVVIGLAVRQFRYDEAGRILEIGPLWFWQEDPGRPLDPNYAWPAGTSNEALVGKKIDTTAATDLFRDADVIVAHDAGCTRKFVERRLPDVAGLPWASTGLDIDWRTAGYNGLVPGWLLLQARPGYFHIDRHALGEVDAIVQLLRSEMPGGRTALRELLDTAAMSTVLICATGAQSDLHDLLDERGYGWDADASVWCREVPIEKQVEETLWLAQNVYRAKHRPKNSGPSVRLITWLERYA